VTAPSGVLSADMGAVGRDGGAGDLTAGASQRSRSAGISPAIAAEKSRARWPAFW
jgi:hypothetical protein